MSLSVSFPLPPPITELEVQRANTGPLSSKLLFYWTWLLIIYLLEYVSIILTYCYQQKSDLIWIHSDKFKDDYIIGINLLFYPLKNHAVTLFLFSFLPPYRSFVPLTLTCHLLCGLYPVTPFPSNDLHLLSRKLTTSSPADIHTWWNTFLHSNT